MDKPVASTKAANSFFKLASFGKRMEFSIISEMLCQGLDVYRPMVDDKGIDAVIRRDDGTYVEVQIKARSNDPDLKVPGAFCAVKCIPRANYWFVFHIAQAGPNGTMWIMRSDEFTDRASKNINGKNKDKYSLHLCGTRQDKKTGKTKIYIKPQYAEFISTNFDRIISGKTVKEMRWDLFSEQPLILKHPEGLTVSVAAVSPVKGGVVWWNAEYLVSLCMPGGLPGSGFANYFIEGEPAFSVEDNAWHIKTKDQRIYEFRQADRDSKAKWNQCRQHLSPIEELHAKAASEFGGRKR